MSDYKVPVGEGYIIGDLLHKYALRGSPSWQIAGYHIGPRAENLGLSEGLKASYLDITSKHLECDDPNVTGGKDELKEMTFVWDGKVYRNDQFWIADMPKILGEKVNALAIYSFGQRTAERNYKTIFDKVGATRINEWTAVTSRHTVSDVLKYKVEKGTEDTEWLCITADDAAVANALKSALKALQALEKEM